jgi:hypothetical protein
MSVDLYSMLMGYAKKNKNPFVNIDEFQVFLKQYAKSFGPGMNEWNLWTQNTDAKFMEEVTAFIDAGVCELHVHRKARYAYLPKCAIALAQSVWGDAIEPYEELERATPFPNELSFGFSPPETSFIVLKVMDLAGYIEQICVEKDAGNAIQEAIIRIDFPGQLSSMLFPSTALDGELLCAALFRIRYYLHKSGNLKFVQQKLDLNFRGREEYPRDILNKLAQTPRDVITDIVAGGEASYLLWKLCCELIKDDTCGKSSLSVDDGIIAQAICIIEQYNTFYGKIEKERKNRRAALEDLLLCFDQAPCIYNLGQVINFTDANQTPLFSSYTSKELDIWLKEKTTPISSGVVPPIVAVTDKKNETWFIKKEKVALVCLRLLIDAQYLVKNAVIEQWEALLEQYQRDPSMDNDQTFETLLSRLVNSLIPPLAAIFRYKMLPLLAIEQDGSEIQHQFARLFSSSTGKLLHISTILFLDRKALLNETLERLPFWHSMPSIVKLIVFMRNLHKQPPSASPARTASNTVNGAPLTFHEVYKKFEAELVPEDYTLDWYLVHLYQMWAKLLNESDRRHLLQDVNYLLRTYVRRHAAFLKPDQVNESFLEENAVNFIEGVPALMHLHDNSLTLYAKLYIIKMLRSTHRNR